MREYVVAVDIGTGSARAGIFDRKGKLLARADRPIAMNRPEENHAEHDSEDIWASVCAAVRAAREKGGVEATDIAAIGFDATCSLVVRDRDGAPLSVNRRGRHAGTRSSGSITGRLPRPISARRRSIPS